MTKNFDNLLEQFLRDDISPGDLQLFLVAVKQPENAETLQASLLQKLESKAYYGIADTRDMEAKFRAMLERADRMSNEASSRTPTR